MKYFLILLFCTASCFGQTPTKAQLKAENALLWQAFDEDQAAIKELQAELTKQKETLQLVLEYVAKQETNLENLRNTNELLRIANSSLSTTRTVVVPAMPMPTVQAPQTIVIKHEAPYQPPVFDSPVHCSGYDIPTPGLTLTYQNCQ